MSVYIFSHIYYNNNIKLIYLDMKNVAGGADMEAENQVEIEENSSNYTSSKYRTPDGFTADNVIFTVTNEGKHYWIPNLQLLMIKRKKWPYKGCWALPGGFINPGEKPLEAAKRELMEETKVSGLHIEHVDVYSEFGRDPRGWIITSSYCALVNEEVLKNREAGDDAAQTELVSLEEILNMQKGSEDGTDEENEGKLAFDHRDIINDALKIVRRRIMSTDVVKELLPEEFTISELYKIIVAISPQFGEQVPEKYVPNFRRKVISRGIIAETQNTTNRSSNSNTVLFKFTGKIPPTTIFD